MAERFRFGHRDRRKNRRAFGEDTTPRVYSVTPFDGVRAGGTAVTIDGDYFIGTPTVLFGGLAATSVVRVDRYTITCVTPASLDDRRVDVSVTCGSLTGTLIGGFTYISPTIVSLSPAYGPIVGGTTITIIGYNFDPSATYDVTIGGDSCTGVDVLDAQHIVATTPPHATGFVDVVLQTPAVLFDPAIFDPAIFDEAVNPAVEYSRLRNGFQYTLLTRGTDIRRMPGITIRDVLNNAPNKATFKIDGTSNTPVVGEKIEIIDAFDGDRLLFAGTVEVTNQVYEGQIDQLAWETTAIDFTALFNKYRPFGEFKQVSVSDIVKTLVSQFAPGFTVNHVQTNLARITVSFNGTQDFSTCMSIMAAAIGGGHWYIDYTQDVHFFHRVPADIILPDFPQVGMHFGPGSAPTVVEGTAIPFTFSYTPGYYMFGETWVYENGVETGLGPLSNVVLLTGNKQITFSALSIGTPIGSHTVVKRRLYYMAYTSDGFVDLTKFAEIGNNTTTGFTTSFGATGAPSTVTAIDPELTLPNRPVANPPAPNVDAPIAAQGTGVTGQPWTAVPPTYSIARWAFKVTNIYRNGVESAPTPASASVLLNGTGGVDLSNILPGLAVNEVDVIARRVYGCAGIVETVVTYTTGVPPPELAALVLAVGTSFNLRYYNNAWFWAYQYPSGSSANEVWYRINDLTTGNGTYAYGPGPSPGGLTYTQYLATLPPVAHSDEVYSEPDWSPDRVIGWTLVPNNTGLTTSFGLALPGGIPPAGGIEDPNAPIPVWPNPDGPSLEDDDPPNDIDDDNDELLHEDSGSQPFTMGIDKTQLRNRVFVIGAGTALMASAPQGSTSLQVTEISIFARSGGKLMANTKVMTYKSITGNKTGPGILELTAQVPTTLPIGTAVNIFGQFDDVRSQQALARIEVDVNGRRTDGVHEHTVSDSTLATPFALYMRGNAELEMFAWPIVTVRYATRDPKSRSGQMVHIDLTTPPCQGDFLIQDVTIDQIHDESDTLDPRYTVSASSVRFDLSDLLLLLLSGNVGGGALLGSNGGPATTSTQATALVAGLQVATVTMTAAQIIALSEVTVVPAPGAGLVAIPVAMWVHSKISSGFDTSRGLNLRYGGAGTIMANAALFVQNIAQDKYVYVVANSPSVPINPSTSGTNKALVVQTDGAIVAGTGTVNVLVLYYVSNGAF